MFYRETIFPYSINDIQFNIFDNELLFLEGHPFMSLSTSNKLSTATIDVRIAVDIGGTFTDVVVETAQQQTTAKVLTTSSAPEQGVITGISDALEQAELAAANVDLVIHGTTLATNAIIERKGAATALITTEGFRDVLDIGYESRYDQYDIFIDKPAALVPRYRRLTVPERVNIQGQVLKPLDEEAAYQLVPKLQELQIESIAVGFLHSYANPSHERRVAEILAQELPDISITLSSEVCPEVREYERLTTASANAYVRPLMASYLARLRDGLAELGLQCPILLMTSGGGLTTLDTAMQFPIRLVESGPAGGAILASRIAAQTKLDKVISFDMGGTTAKICLIENAEPQSAREFEIDRAARFMKGSGLPLRIPVIEMVEIGAGGGSIARLDALQRITIGPDSAGAEPGPAAYNRGGQQPTITDADIQLGRIDPERFAGGKVKLDSERSAQAILQDIGTPLQLDVQTAAYGIAEMVDETMANAARVHAVERGKIASEHALIAFGGAAPLHVCRLAEKLGIDRIIIPTNAGVGSAVGFLRAPVAYEVVRSRNMRLKDFAADQINLIFAEMYAEASTVVRAAAPDVELVQTRFAFMRYFGQGHEIVVALPLRDLSNSDSVSLQTSFDQEYRRLYKRTIPDGEVEVLTWALSLSTPATTLATTSTVISEKAPTAIGMRRLFDTTTSQEIEAALYWRPELEPGMTLEGPALIAENETSTFVSERFNATINADQHIILQRKEK